MIERWMEPPRLRLPEEEAADRRATWLELFFDLVFAAAVAEVGNGLSAHYTLAGLARFGFQFALIWWAWTGHTFFSTRFDNDDPLHRMLTLAQVFLAAVMAVNADGTMAGREMAGFVAGYAGIRLLLAVQYGRVVTLAATRRFARRQRLWTTVAAGLWLVSAMAPERWRFWVWGLALVVEVATSLAAGKVAPALPVDPAHLVERFGLFTLILFGQAVVAVMAGMRQREVWTTGAATSALLGLVLVFGLWWAYFDGLAAAGPRPASSRFHGWAATHFPLCFAIAVAAVGIEHVIARDGSVPLGQGGPLLVGAMGLVALALGVLAIAAAGGPANRSVRTLAIHAALTLGLVPAAIAGTALPPVWLLGWLVGFVIILNVVRPRGRSQHFVTGSQPIGITERPAVRAGSPLPLSND